MYSLIKQYKNIFNHQVNGKFLLITHSGDKERVFLLEFYPLFGQNSRIKYFPIYNQMFGVKKILKQDFLEEPSELVLQLRYKKRGKEVDDDFFPFLFQTANFNFEINFFPKVLNSLFFNSFFKLLKKKFQKLELKKNYPFVWKKRKFFFNRIIRKKIYEFNFDNTLEQLFFSIFLKKCLYCMLYNLNNLKKEEKQLPLYFYQISNKFLYWIFKFPLISIKFYKLFEKIDAVKKKTFVKFAKTFLDLILRQVLFFRLDFTQPLGFNICINEELFVDAANINLNVSNKKNFIKEWKNEKLKNDNQITSALQKTKVTFYKLILKKIAKNRLEKCYLKLNFLQPKTIL